MVVSLRFQRRGHRSRRPERRCYLALGVRVRLMSLTQQHVHVRHPAQTDAPGSPRCDSPRRSCTNATAATLPAPLPSRDAWLQRPTQSLICIPAMLGHLKQATGTNRRFGRRLSKLEGPWFRDGPPKYRPARPAPTSIPRSGSVRPIAVSAPADFKTKVFPLFDRRYP